MNKPVLKWSPALPIRRPNNIISSTAEPAFTPSYEREKRENMNYLMSNEYMRIWFKERSVYEKNTYTRLEIIKGESKIKRRMVQRLMTYKKPTKNQFIDDLVERKYGSSAQNVVDKMKFKIDCPEGGAGKAGSGKPDALLLIKTTKATKTGKKKGTAKQTEEDDECDNDENAACILECEQEE